jgi:hypothetical protein
LVLGAWGAKLWLAIVGPSQVRSHPLVRMRVAALHHTEMAGELITLRVAVSPVAELVRGCSPNETSRVEVTNELVTKFWRREELCSQLEGPGARICNLLLGPPPSQARWADSLAEATRWLEVELTPRRLVDAKLGALQTLAAHV